MYYFKEKDDKLFSNTPMMRYDFVQKLNFLTILKVLDKILSI